MAPPPWAYRMAVLLPGEEPRLLGVCTYTCRNIVNMTSKSLYHPPNPCFSYLVFTLVLVVLGTWKESV